MIVLTGLHCSEHLPFWDCWLAAQCSRAFHDLRLHLPVLRVVTCLSVLSVRGSLQGIDTSR